MRRKPRIKCVTYGGRVGWFLRKHFSRYTSRAYLILQYRLRERLFKRYINAFNEARSKGKYFLPCIIAIETINRCNSTCEFCPVNRNIDPRPFSKMSNELFRKIITELAELKFSGWLNIFCNNEPFMDSRIEDMYKYASEMLPDAKLFIYTNGTIMTPERFRKIIPYVHKMIVNNYTEDYELHENIRKVYELVKANPEYWDKDITIQIRYIKEILTNRANTAPNRTRPAGWEDDALCVMPFTDFNIYTDGTVGLCCNDALEKTSCGNLNTSSIYEIWTSPEYQAIRNILGYKRSGYAFCKGCDFIDAGIRNDIMKEILRSL